MECFLFPNLSLSALAPLWLCQFNLFCRYAETEFPQCHAPLCGGKIKRPSASVRVRPSVRPSGPYEVDIACRHSREGGEIICLSLGQGECQMQDVCDRKDGGQHGRSAGGGNPALEKGIIICRGPLIVPSREKRLVHWLRDISSWSCFASLPGFSRFACLYATFSYRI